MYLLDTNCWMQLARDRLEANRVRQMLEIIPADRVFLSDFSVHSIGVLFSRRGMIGSYGEFLRQVSIGSSVRVVEVPVQHLDRLIAVAEAHSLDFDDAYQYVAAELHGLKLVSLDADFDRTPNGRLTPTRALEVYRHEQRASGMDA